MEVFEKRKSRRDYRWGLVYPCLLGWPPLLQGLQKEAHTLDEHYSGVRERKRLHPKVLEGLFH